MTGLAALHARLLRDRALQFEFTSRFAPGHPHQPGWMKALGLWIARAMRAATPWLIGLFWVGVAAALALIVFLIVREIAGVRIAGRRRESARRAPVDWRPEAHKARALLEDADRLAGQGLYDQAVRLLLFRGIDDIDNRRPHLLRPALTARDIAALDDLPPEARRAFGGIVRAVERSLFGGRRLDADAFAACRADYVAFAFPKVWA